MHVGHTDAPCARHAFLSTERGGGMRRKPKSVYVEGNRFGVFYPLAKRGSTQKIWPATQAHDKYRNVTYARARGRHARVKGGKNKMHARNACPRGLPNSFPAPDPII